MADEHVTGDLIRAGGEPPDAMDRARVRPRARRRTRAGVAAGAAIVAVLAGSGCSARRADPPSAVTQPTTSPSVAPPTTRVRVGADDMLTRTAARFEAFAKGSSASLPVDTPVDLYLGGRKVTTLQSPATEQRASWQICPPGGEYAAATCPFSAVDVLRDADDLSVTPTPHGPPCVAGSEPATLAAYQQISITVGATCVDWAAVTLYLNDVSQLVAVDLTMAEP